MNLDEFRATKRELPIGDSSIPQHVIDGIEYEIEAFESVFLYDGETWIGKRKNGFFWLQLGRDEYESRDISEIEPHLYHWAESEGFFE